VDAFELAAFQTTNEDYARFVESTRHPAPPQWDDPNFSDPRQPVVAVSWFDAVAYCEWLSRAAGKRYRLPSEAEWERAARGGAEDQDFPWGNCPPEDISDYANRWKSGPERVGLYAPNAYGLHNLGDNVHEWCSDWYDAAYYAVSPERNPQGPAAGNRRASRGGSWRHHIKVTRTAARSSIPPEFKYADYGFRVASL
jgi:formylglycine-generating enzyme required for sulfatase activity